MTKDSMTTIVLERDPYNTWFANRKELMKFLIDSYSKGNFKNFKITITVSKEEMTNDEVTYFNRLEEGING